MTRITRQVKKQQVEAAVLFAIQHVSDIDTKTLRWYLELVNVTGELRVSKDELKEKMRLVSRYIPGSCSYSLLVLADLLEISTSHSFANPRLCIAPAVPAIH